MVKILIKKFDKNIKLPVYKTYGSSGMDIVAHTKNKITIRTVKKAGNNQGKMFYICARGVGRTDDPNANCNYFQWKK